MFDVLERVRTHPTADEIFRQTRRAMPDISLATVYKALDAFVACGAVRKMATSGDPARFDVRTDPHHHFHCLGCRRVLDVEDPGIGEWILDRGVGAGMTVSGFSLVLEGYCRDCAS